MTGQETSHRQGNNGASPWFARVASGLLKSGDPEEALRVCLAGTRAFPRYTTGRLLLGQCFDALGRHVEAMLEYRQVIEIFPDNPVVAELVKNAKEREQLGYSAFLEQRLARLHGRKDRLTFEDYVGSQDVSHDSSVERILRQLEEAPKRIVPPPEGEEPAAAPSMPSPEPAGRLVTATLAEIYASQGEFGEAIDAYRKLAEQRPGSAERYQKRLRELEELRRLQDPDAGR